MISRLLVDVLTTIVVILLIYEQQSLKQKRKKTFQSCYGHRVIKVTMATKNEHQYSFMLLCIHISNKTFFYLL